MTIPLPETMKLQECGKPGTASLSIRLQPFTFLGKDKSPPLSCLQFLEVPDTLFLRNQCSKAVATMDLGTQFFDNEVSEPFGVEANYFPEAWLTVTSMGL